MSFQSSKIDTFEPEPRKPGKRTSGAQKSSSLSLSHGNMENELPGLEIDFFELEPRRNGK